jgi:hypothetical protein
MALPFPVDFLYADNISLACHFGCSNDTLQDSLVIKRYKRSIMLPIPRNHLCLTDFHSRFFSLMLCQSVDVIPIDA